jgi:uncharacterized protein (TIGR03067 family)
MKQPAGFVIGLLSLCSFAYGGGDTNKDDLKQLQGKWEFVERIIDGKKGDLKGTWTITGNEISYAPNSTVKAVFKLNATTKPKSLEYDDVSKDPKVVTPKGLQGIYEIDGDTLRICVAKQGKERPKTFESKEGSGHVLTVLKRVKEEK